MNRVPGNEPDSSDMAGEDAFDHAQAPEPDLEEEKEAAKLGDFA